MTIDEVIHETRRLSIRLSATSAGKLQVDAPANSVTPHLRAALLEHKEELMVQCREDPARSGNHGNGSQPAGEVSNTPAQSQSPARLPHIPSFWPSHEPGADAAWLEEFGWVSHLGPEDLPRAPFPLDKSRTVVDKTKFLSHLQEDVARGAQGPRARTGSVQEDCRILRGILSAACGKH